MPTDTKEAITGGAWSFACDSYGKVRHSKMACVYTVLMKDHGEQIVSVASRIKNWEDAKLIAAAPAMSRVLAAVLHQLEQGEASDALDIGIFGDGTQDDLRWCRDQIKSVLKVISTP